MTMTMMLMMTVSVVMIAVMLVMVVCGVLMVVGSTARAHGRCFALHPPVSDVLTTTMSTMPSNYSTTLATTMSMTARLASLVIVFIVWLDELQHAAVMCCRGWLSGTACRCAGAASAPAAAVPLPCWGSCLLLCWGSLLLSSPHAFHHQT